MKDFAKLFRTDKGQILIKFDANAEGKPEIRFYSTPPNLGVCSLAVTFDDTDDGWLKAEEAFNDKIDEDYASRLQTKMFDQIDELAIAGSDAE